ncbi:MAG: guanylate kinase [Flavobacteriales bacterium]|nr:guanylate kinase [Flavobacteriales bacterium]MBT3964389.1 guanylate kinase [Flavobacteriales bacterium]MBT4705835.1 guanylate kinase [Flavobacteriales bacterium]MBT4931601.1 guanylate kinase [Flavobacteriales bacterium]MBT5133828.1 guanylate kinase [Flavobacteriales bacterium]
MNPSGKSIIFSAPSGAGKTTIVHALLRRQLPLEFSISAASRDARGHERDGVDYHFLGIDGFKSKIQAEALLEWEEVYPDQFYGTLRSEISRIWENGNAVVFDVDVYGALKLKNELKEQALAIFIEPPSESVLETRLRGRQTESEEKIQIRLAKAREELSMKDKFDISILNEDLGLAIEQAMTAVVDFLKNE